MTRTFNGNHYLFLLNYNNSLEHMRPSIFIYFTPKHLIWINLTVLAFYQYQTFCLSLNLECIFIFVEIGCKFSPLSVNKSTMIFLLY